MTSEIETLKTNEFLRRRKLRILQVREQSKDIAKRIRQRAKAEELKRISELDAKKGQEYLYHQDKLVKRLELLCARSLQNVGASHQSASEVTKQGLLEKKDLSKERGREAAAELRKKRQDTLDEQKRLLERKLKAREAANEISREKSTTVASKLTTKEKPLKSQDTATDVRSDNAGTAPVADTKTNEEKHKSGCVDMATQWDLDGLPQEWEPHASSLPKNSPIEGEFRKPEKIERKKHDLFALSDEMQSCLLGGLTNFTDDVPPKPSLTLVSEYLQNGRQRLRESEKVSPHKRKDVSEYLQNGRQRLREPETIHSHKNQDLQEIRQTILRTRAAKEAKHSVTQNAGDEIPLLNKRSVTTYNHATKDTRDVPIYDKRYVVRDLNTEDDAYSQAMRESSSKAKKDKHKKKALNLRSRIAVSKENIEKEYLDTMAFLSSLPKDKTKPIRKAFMDESRQHLLKKNRQRKMQDEFNKIARTCIEEEPVHRHISKSPEFQENFEEKDFQYSWLPVPESDCNLAIHTIPTTMVGDGRCGNSVKFTKVDNYHEYRSRHGHTPPTKDVPHSHDKARDVNSIVMEQDEEESSDCSSNSTSSGKREETQHRKGGYNDLSRSEKTLMYKILKAKKEKEKKGKTSQLEKGKHLRPHPGDINECDERQNDRNSDVKMSVEQLSEGIYRTVSEKGDNIASIYYDNHSDEGRKNGHTVLHKPRGNPTTASIQKQTDIRNKLGSRFEPGDDISAPDRSHVRSSTLKGKREHGDNNRQTSTATSNASFKTATADKVVPPVDGFIRFVDDAGQEPGKFYVGASGFLKDDDYEVVIQLKKKGSTKDNAQADSSEKTQVVEAPTSPSKQSIPNKTTKNVEVHERPMETTHEEKSPLQYQNNPDEQTARLEKSTDEPVITQTEKGTTSMSNVNVCANIETERYRATSICTQTSMSPPSGKPLYFRMSSSTSTAYMSPPELILPNFLRDNYIINSDDPNNPIIPTKKQDGTIEITDEEFCKNCATCPHAIKVIVNKVMSHLSADANIGVNRASIRSPSSVYTASCNRRTVNERLYKTGDTSKSVRNVETKCRKCHKCESNNEALQKCQKSRSCKLRRHAEVTNKKLNSRNQLSSQQTFRSPRSSASFNAKVPQHSNKKPELNPMVKLYVDKLLSLNKQSIKAIEVVNEECSSVATPGSSIVDVPQNIDINKPVAEKISFQQIKELLTTSILETFEKNHNEKLVHTENPCQKVAGVETGVKEKKLNKLKDIIIQSDRNRKVMPRKKSLHRVKSLNISKNITNKPSKNSVAKESRCFNSPSSVSSRKRTNTYPCTNKTVSPSTSEEHNLQQLASDSKKNRRPVLRTKKAASVIVSKIGRVNKATTPSHEFMETDIVKGNNRNNEGKTVVDGTPDIELSLNTSTQTSQYIDHELNFMKIAEDKLQNIEKIADLTEKCTQRLSNLAKVLDEVRKNKSLAYSQGSESGSETGHRQDGKTEFSSLACGPTLGQASSADQAFDKQTTQAGAYNIKENVFLSTDDKPLFKRFLETVPTDLPNQKAVTEITEQPSCPSNDIENIDKAESPLASTEVKTKPHQLSTVLEIDSPVSDLQKSNLELKRNYIEKNSNRHGKLHRIVEFGIADYNELENQTGFNEKEKKEISKDSKAESKIKDADEEQQQKSFIASTGEFKMQGNQSQHEKQKKKLSVSSPVEPKMQMMDLNQFNEIMLKPFMSIEEYAKQCNILQLDEGSNLDDIVKDIMHDELSSLQSEGSIPDVITELLKRNIISEPFKFDSTSNVNSTTVSSESASTFSILALSKMQRQKKKSSFPVQNKENVTETSDTLSISSNPDLENAFKQLGLGWASSTLKKTKERLALSSSTNTSSSSLSQFKVKNFTKNHEILMMDSVSSMNNSKKPMTNNDNKNAEQQTSQTNAMTVKQFLTKELAKKITFTNKTRNDDTEEEFISLYETKVPEEMKHSLQMIQEDKAMDSGSNNRARTSTPVQIYRANNYHTSSSSNMSNGLFSNAEDLSSVKGTSNSIRNHSTSEKDLTVPNCSLRYKKPQSDCSKSD